MLLQQVFIYKTHSLPQLYQFKDLLKAELANKSPYKVSIDSIRLKVQELQEINLETQETKKKNGYKEIDRVFYH